MIAGESKCQQLIPPPELAPPSVKHLPLAKRIEIWAQLVDEKDALVRAGLRERSVRRAIWRRRIENGMLGGWKSTSATYTPARSD